MILLVLNRDNMVDLVDIFNKEEEAKTTLIDFLEKTRLLEEIGSDVINDIFKEKHSVFIEITTNIIMNVVFISKYEVI
jgi:hypothetical protein